MEEEFNSKIIKILLILFYFRLFRVVSAEKFLESFASDRRHMRRPDDTWIKPPPNYEPIQIPGN